MNFSDPSREPELFYQEGPTILADAELFLSHPINSYSSSFSSFENFSGLPNIYEDANVVPRNNSFLSVFLSLP